MERNYSADKKFEKTDFTKEPLLKGDYENCIFSHCDLSNNDLSEIRFVDCEFSNTNLSLTKLIKTSFKDVQFNNCKLAGLHFENCDDFLFSVSFEHCTLNLSSFYGLKLKKTNFKHCILHEVDFTDADLSSSVFHDCDLLNAIFKNTILEKADLQTAYNYSIDPELNSIKKAKFSVNGIAGLLHKYDIDIS